MHRGGSEGKVLLLDRYRGLPRRPPREPVEKEMMDEASRNLHAAALAAMRLVALMRHRMGLPQL